MSLSLFFPLILAYMAKAGTGADTTEHYLQTRFDYVYTMMLGYGLVFLLPCLIGIIAAILFFIERDCDTSKNLRTIPVTNTQLIMAKISMLFIFSITFCLISTLSVALFCKLFHVGMVYGMAYKIFMSLIFGVLIVAASLPIVFLIILNMNTNYIIETKNLTKQYGSQKSVADLNIHVKRGRIYGLLGRNGAGKTTTMKMLLGLTKPTSGEVKIWGKPLQGNEKKLLPRIGSLIESPGFYPNLTGTENLRIFATLRGVPNNHAIKDALDLVGLPYKDKKLFSQYSLGMKQRLAIALAVMHDPELLILDEPINGLDPIGIAEVRSFIRELCDARGKTILISSHILSEISLLADDIGIIDHGALLEEESLAELEQKSSKHIRFTLSDTAQAARILERNFHENHFSIQDDHNLRLHNLDLPVGKIVTAFVENGLEVSEAHTCEESLEDYFKRVTGGEGIA